MNRLQFLLRSKTQYNLHSPFVYRLYTQVLALHKKDYEGLVEALAGWAGAAEVELQEETAVVRSRESVFLIQRAPHACRAAEQRFEELSGQYPVSIDLYHTAVHILNPHLHPQRFLLR